MAAAEKLAARLNGSPQASRVVVVSFDDTILAHFRELAPDVATSPGLSTMTEWFLTRGDIPGHRVLQVPPTYGDITVVTPQFVTDAHAAGVAVWVWFNGEGDDVPSVWNDLLDMGVDGLVTGKPRAAQAVLDARGTVFSAAPTIVGRAAVSRGVATVQASCPTVHTARCDSDVVVVAQTDRGRWFLVGEIRTAMGRGATVSVPMTLSADARRRARPGNQIGRAHV